MPKDAIALFLSFCIEQYKVFHKINGNSSMKILASSGALDYLEQNYDVLHTQSPQWIVEEINEYVANHPAL